MEVSQFVKEFQNEGEIFVPVLNFEKRFQISNHGRLITVNGKYLGIRFINPFMSSLGYYEISLRQTPLNRKVRIHTLVAEHFCTGKTNEICWVNHIDGNKLNNHHTNLEWVTPGDNVRHAVRTGLMDVKGVRHFNNKLTEQQVIELRHRASLGQTHKSIAAIFGINRRHVGDIVNGGCWGWLKQPSDFVLPIEYNPDAA